MNKQFAIPISSGTSGGGAGSSAVLNIPTTASPSVPSPLYTGATESPDSLTPNIYVQDVNGQWHAQGGIDTQTVDAVNGPPLPGGTLTFSRRVYFRDTLHPTQVSKNAFVSINHAAVAGTVCTNQDRALAIGMSNITATVVSFSITNNVVTMFVGPGPVGSSSGVDRFQNGQTVVPSGLSTGTYLNNVQFVVQTASALNVPTAGHQILTLTSNGFTHANVSSTADGGFVDQVMYSMAGNQIELDVYGNPVIQAEIDSEFSAASFQLSDYHTNSIAGPSLGVNALRLNYFRQQGAGAWGGGSNSGPSTLRIGVVNSSAVNSSGMTMYGIVMTMFDGGTANNLSAMGLLMSPSAIRFPNTNIGIQINDFGTNVSDWNFRSMSTDGTPTSGRNWLGGNVYLPNIVTSATTIGITGSVATTGSISTSALPNPAQPTNVIPAGTPGSTTYGYKIVARDGNGNPTAASAETRTTTGNLTLNSSNFNIVEYILTPGASSYDIYRTTGGATQGKIASFTQTNSVINTLGIISDTGLVGDSTTPSSQNLTGGIKSIGTITPGQYTVSTLPAGSEGQTAYATNGRKVGEGSGSGTGAPVYFSNSQWRVYSTDAQVQA